MHRSRDRSRSGGGAAQIVYDPAAEALFARMSPAIANDEKAVYNTAIVALKAAGLWATLDCMGSLVAPHSQAAYLNWTESDHTITAVNSPTLTPYVGGVTNGSTSYFSIDYIPDTDKVNLAQNSATIACEIIAGTDALASVNSFGVSDGSNQLLLIPWRTGNTAGVRVNGSILSVSGATVTSRLGMLSSSRTAAGALEIYKNGASIGTDTDASTGVPATYPVFIGGQNNAGALLSPVANTFGAWALGGQWTATQHDDFYDIMTAYRVAMTP